MAGLFANVFVASKLALALFPTYSMAMCCIFSPLVLAMASALALLLIVALGSA